MSTIRKFILVFVVTIFSFITIGCPPNVTTVFLNATNKNLVVMFDDKQGKHSCSLPSAGSTEVRIATVDRSVRVFDTGGELFHQTLPRYQKEHYESKRGGRHGKIIYLVTEKGVFLIPVANWENWKENLDKIIPNQGVPLP